MKKKGSYKTRRLKRRVCRKMWRIYLTTRFCIRLVIYKLMMGLLKIDEAVFRKVLKIKEIGEGIYEGKYEKRLKI